MIRLVIADDHPIVRHGLLRLLEQQRDMRVVREVIDGRQALRAVEEHEPDVLVLDLSLPKVNGMEVTRRVSASHPAVRVVVLSMYAADQYEERLREIGAAAYVSKDAPPEDLLRAIRAVASGGQSTSEPVTKGAAEDTAARPPHKTLSAREYQVFTLLFQGRTVTEIAAELDLTSSTVSNHVAKIREKLQVRSIGEIVRYAYEVGLAGRAQPAR